MNINLFKHFNPNNRVNLILDQSITNNPTLSERIFNCALPLFCMYQPAAKIFTVISATIISNKLLNTAFDHYQRGEYAEGSKKISQMTFVITSIAISILIPDLAIILSSSYLLTKDLGQFCMHIKGGRLKDAAMCLLNMSGTLIYLGAHLYATPEMLILSLLTQAAKELYRSKKEFTNGCHLEGIANLIYAGIRGYQAAPHLQTIHRNHYGKMMTQSDLDTILAEIKNEQSEKNNNKLIKLERYLQKNYISNRLNNLTFDQNNQIKHIYFNNIKFNSCNLNGVSFIENNYKNVVFKNCNLKETKMIDSIFNKTTFVNTDLNRTEFNRSCFDLSNFMQCDLSETIFNDTWLNGVMFLSNTMQETCFFNADVSASAIIESDLTDCLLFDTKEHFFIAGGKPHKVTKPIIGLLWNFDENLNFTKFINDALKKVNTIPFRFHFDTNNVDISNLNDEVIENIEKHKISNSQIPIPRYILNQTQTGSESEKIKKVAQSISQHIDGLVLPGGEDIQPLLYGQEPVVDSNSQDGDYRRSLMECALIYEAEKDRIPTYGICRGNQILNVAFGGTLTQHVDNHNGVFHNLQLDPSTLHTNAGKIAFDILQGNNIRAYSSHHQAHDKIGEGLTCLLYEEGSPEMVISNDGNFIGTQFHPEILSNEKYAHHDTYKNNRNFFVNLMMRAADKMLTRV